MDKREGIAEQLFGEALDLPPEQREAYLEEACRGAPELRLAVEALLAEDARLRGFLSVPPHGGSGGAGESETLAAGTRLGRYTILEPLGSGGMGAVYRGRDEKLERMVAIKVLTPGVFAGEEARRHFRREALALAKLNHAHIAAVYDADEQDGASYIVMELVEGQSLAARLRAGALPVKEATSIALEVAEALEEAHESGVIHRDLKPGNVMVTPKGRTKVLDFGLAKMLAQSGEATKSITDTSGIFGTPLYMSPEQAQGRSVDGRTDLWSLGVLYYQSLTGRAPFRGESNLAILQAIVTQPLPAMGPEAAGPAEPIVTRALEKDVGLRYQTARDFATDLRRALRDLEPRPATVSGTGSTGVGATEAAPGRRRGAAVALGMGSVVALLGVGWLFRPTVASPHVTGMRQLTHDGNPKWVAGVPAEFPLFTDGSRVYFQESNLSDFLVMQVSMQGGETERVPMPFRFAALTDVSAAQSKMLVQTPVNAAASEGELWTLPLPTGQPQRIGNLAPEDAKWGPDGDSLYYMIGPELWLTHNDGSRGRKILTAPAGMGWLRFSPDGRRMRFSTFNSNGASALWEAGADGSGLRRVLPGWDACCGSWTPDGKYFVFASTRGGGWNLWAMREKRDWWRRSNSQPVQLTLGEMMAQSPLPAEGGRTIFFLGTTPRGELVRYDRVKRAFVPYLPGLSANDLAFSRDGSKLAYVSAPEGAVWESKADGTDRHELTFPPMQASLPRWSPDGTQIAFAAREPGKPEKIYVLPIAAGVPQQVTTGPDDDGDPSWSPDGNALAYAGSDPANAESQQHRILILDLKSHAVTALPGSDHYFSPRWSPDGRWLAAIDDDTYALELYSFATHSWEELTHLSTAYPNWTSDSRCILFEVAQGPFAARLPYYRICLADRKPQLLVNLADGGQLVSGTFTYWTGVTPDGSILGIRDISIEEVYALDVQLP